MILSVPKDSTHTTHIRKEAVVFVGLGNQEAILAHCRGFTKETYMWYLVRTISVTTSVEIFERLYTLCDPELYPPYNMLSGPVSPHSHLEETMKGLLLICLLTPIERSALTLVTHLEIRYNAISNTLDNDHTPPKLLEMAAKSGHPSILAYIIEVGYVPDAKVLDAACKHGNPACVRLILEKISAEEFEDYSALLEDVNRENSAVVHLLMESKKCTLPRTSSIAYLDRPNKRTHVWPDRRPMVGSISKVVEFAEREGLHSMAEMMRVCKVEF